MRFATVLSSLKRAMKTTVALVGKEGPGPNGSRDDFLNVPFDQIDQDTALSLMDTAHPSTPFRYVVTPNADHVVRLNRTPALRPYYDDAWMTLCDSKPISLFARTRSRPMTHVPGSDLTVSLFRSVIRHGDRIALIVGNEKVAADLRAAYPGIDFRTHVPPIGLWTNAKAQQDCVDFVVQERGRFTFLAVGSPQAEKIAHMISQHGDATGIGLCIGASLEFLVGAKKRAPLWMQRLSLEWLHRLASDPKRLWRRYVYGVAPLLALFVRETFRAKPATQRSVDSAT